MTEKLYDKDSHLIEFTAKVIDSYKKADGYLTVLDRTAFFPEGGGQASDIGYINDAEVYDVQIADGMIYHYTTKPFNKGEAVVGRLNFKRRFDFMQQHSGEHIISGIAHSLYGCENVGFHLGLDIVTLDFDKMLSKEQVSLIEAKANEVVFNNVKFNTYYPEKEELENLAYRSKKELEGDIRIVEIEGVDMCACCAPHVNFSGEIGLIKLLATEKLRSGIRIQIKCGKRALDDYILKYENVSKISNLLCVKQKEAYEAVNRIYEQNAALRFEITEIRKQILTEKIESYQNEKEISALFEDGLEVKNLQFFADMLYKKFGGIRAVFSKCEEGFRFAICGEETHLAAFFANFKAKFSVKGGGRGPMVQGIVMADMAQILSFFE